LDTLLGHFALQRDVIGFDSYNVAATYLAGLIAEELWCTGKPGEHGAEDDLLWIERDSVEAPSFWKRRAVGR
jgi:hypothetical protein